MKYFFYLTIILFIVIFSAIGNNNNLVAADTTFAPKFKITFNNEVNDTAKLYFGVDSQATDGWDADVPFIFEDTILKEDLDLPPIPPNSLSCRIIRDTLHPSDSYSYVDMRSIPEDKDEFCHKYIIKIFWTIQTNNPTICAVWGKLPKGIDSAKIRCYEWLDDNKFINMKNDESVILDNSAYKTMHLWVWYNKKNTCIYNSVITQDISPNPANDYIRVTDNNYSNYSIYDLAGNLIKYDIISNKHLFVVNLNNCDNTLFIDIQNLIAGQYTIMFQCNNGNLTSYFFIKN